MAIAFAAEWNPSIRAGAAPSKEEPAASCRCDLMKSCDELLCAVALTKTYPSVAPGVPDLELFRDLNLHVAEGEMVAIVGESGAGKSTLLHLLAALDCPTAGEVWCGFTHVTGLSQAEASTLP